MIKIGPFRLGENYVMCLECGTGLHRDMFNNDDEEGFDKAKTEFVMGHMKKCEGKDE